MRIGSDILAELDAGKKTTEKGDAQKRRYPWSRHVDDGKKVGLDKSESAERGIYLAGCVSRLPSKTKESGRCKDCGKPPKEDSDAS